MLYYFESFGSNAYWIGPNASSNKGALYVGLACTVATMNASITIFGYYSIRRKCLKVLKSSEVGEKRQSTTTRCLSTYVGIAVCLYFPMVISLWTNVSIVLLTHKTEPFTSMVSVIVANSSGLANCWGYFRNERIRRKRFQEKLRLDAVPTVKENCNKSSDAVDSMQTELTNMTNN